MKNVFKNRKLIAIIGGVIILLAVGITCIVLNTNKKEEAPIHKEETHTMFVKINPFVKLVFKQEYSICKDSAGREYICGDESNNVVDYELINDDAKDFYKDLDFKNKSLYDALLMLCETAVDNNIVFENLEITTDSDNIKVEQITDYLQEKSKYEITYTVNVNFEEHIDEEKIIEDEETESQKYLISFDSDGGSKVESQSVTKGSKVSIPTTPTKNGYKFVEWQFNGKSFDFNTEITADITLKAKWEKENTNNNQTTKPNENESNNNNQTTKPSENESNNNNQTTKPSENESNNNNQTTKPSESGNNNNNNSSTNNRQGVINLNDNVLYTLSGPPASQDYASWRIKDVCFNKTIAELKEIDPNYGKEVVEDYAHVYKDDTLITKHIFLESDTLSLLYMFPACKDTIPASYKNILDNAMGWKFLSIAEDDTFEVKLIQLDKRYQWETYHQEIDFSKYNLSEPNPYSGGGEAPTPQLLTEQVCSEYHLKCDRW